MYGLLSKLIITGKLKFEPGRITVFQLPFHLMDLYALKQMTNDAMDGGKREISKLYFYGWAYGFNTTTNIAKILKLKKFQERYKIAMDIIGLLGFGDYQTLSFKRADHAKFKVLNNPFGMLYHPSDKMVCHYIRGMEAGGGSIVHEAHFDNIETECTAKNGKYCIHQNLNQKNLDNFDKNLVDAQLDREYLKKRKIQIIEELGADPKKYGIE